MSSIDACIDKAAQSLDHQYGSFDNYAHVTGTDKAFQLGLRALNVISPSAAQTVDTLFGAGKLLLDQNGDGCLQFAELAPVAKVAADIMQI